ncbi:hypothetical protein DFH09DRAFT_1072838 [Mycena vulgaris]|nr:hypothetical protein DFH09DRAFT_1072838 [Mycena vulgaris]
MLFTIEQLFTGGVGVRNVHEQKGSSTFRVDLVAFSVNPQSLTDFRRDRGLVIKEKGFPALDEASLRSLPHCNPIQYSPEYSLTGTQVRLGSYKVDSLGTVNALAGTNQSDYPLGSRGRRGSLRGPQLLRGSRPSRYSSNVKSRVYSPTKASAARSKRASDADLQVEVPAVNVPIVEPSSTLENPVSLSTVTADSPAVATRTRARTRSTSTLNPAAQSFDPEGAAQSQIGSRALAFPTPKRFHIFPPLRNIMTSVPADFGSPLTPLPRQLAGEMETPEIDRELEGEVYVMDREYTENIMGKIKAAYVREHEQESSILSRASLLAKKKSLEPPDVMDRGVTSDRDHPRFALNSRFAYLVKKTTADMQSLLKSASGLVKGRNSHFVIDPQSTLIGILNGAESLAEMHIAWVGLSRRLELSQRFLDKYMLEFQSEEEGVRPSSPVSTADGVYERIPREGSNVDRLTFFFENVAHHRSQLPEEYDRDRGGLVTTLVPPDRLARAFPERPVEESPSTVYYSAEGERRERAMWDRTGWGRDQSFPVSSGSESSNPSHQSKGKGRQMSRPVERMIEIHEEEEGDLDYLDEDEDEAQAPVNPIASIFGPSALKSNDNLFPARSPPVLTRVKAIPGPNLPNTLQGLAAPSAYGYLNDSASQAGFQAKNWNRSSAGATPVNRNIYASVGPDPETIDPPPRRERDTPPHMSTRGGASFRAEREFREDGSKRQRSGGISAGDDGGEDPDKDPSAGEIPKKPTRHRGNFESRRNPEDRPNGDRNQGPPRFRGPPGAGGPPDGGDGGSSDNGAPSNPRTFRRANLATTGEEAEEVETADLEQTEAEETPDLENEVVQGRKWNYFTITLMSFFGISASLRNLFKGSSSRGRRDSGGA